MLLSIAAAVLLIPFASLQATGRLPVASVPPPLATLPVVLISGRHDTAPGQARETISRPVRPASVRTPPVPGPLPGVRDSAAGEVSYGRHYGFSGVVPQLDMPQLKQLSTRVISRRLPLYPASARRRGIEGRVVVEFGVARDGTVVDPIVVESMPSAIFNRAVLDAVKHYRYEPPRLNGEAINLTGLREEFRFQLGDGQSSPPSASSQSVPFSPQSVPFSPQSVSSLDSG